MAKKNVTRRLAFSWFALGLLGMPCVAHPEVVFDGTLGPAGNLTGNMIVADTMGQTVGSNLFHSFSVFNVNTGESVTFSGAPNIANVIGRVTGGGISTIDGPLASTIAGANLWMINPNGIVFGVNASLNIDGSFHASTANYITLNDGGRFDATDSSNSVLTVAPPASFGFLDNNPNPISVNDSVLQVPESQILSLVGGDIDITGGPAGILGAQSGRVDIVSVASTGEAVPNATGLNVDSFSGLGVISLSQNAAISVSELAGFNGSGSIYLIGGNIVIDNATLFANTFDGSGGVVDINAAGDLFVQGGSTVTANTSGPGLSPDIAVNVGRDMILTGASKISTSAADIGDAGDIVFNVGNLNITDSSRIFSDTSGAGNAGDITVNAEDTASIVGPSDFTVGIASTSTAFFDFGRSGDILINAPNMSMYGGTINTQTLLFSFGNAGDIILDVDRLEMANQGIISTSSSSFGNAGNLFVTASSNVTLMDEFTTLQSTSNSLGNAGGISITSPDLNILNSALIQTSTFSDGVGGDVTINVDRLKMENGRIDSDAKFMVDSLFNIIPSTGSAGNILITAADGVTLVNKNNDPLNIPEISSTTFGTGTGGIISISTPNLTVDHGGIRTSAEFSTGGAGAITLNVDTLSLFAGGFVSGDTFSSGVGGNIVINSTKSITISGESLDLVAVPHQSSISTTALDLGNAGTINITTPTMNIDQGNISATAADVGNAGSVTLAGIDQLTLTGGGNIQARTLGSSLGGNLDITARVVSAKGRDKSNGSPSGFFSRSEGDGMGGNVTIRAERIVMDGGAAVSSNASGNGNAGSVALIAGDFMQLQDSSVTTRSSQSAGGNIDVQAVNRIYLINSEITTSAAGVTVGNDGGNISVDPEFILLKNSNVVAQANAGNGGNILLVSDQLIADPGSLIDASSNTGIDGTVVIEAPDKDISGSMNLLNVPLLDVANLLRKRCAVAALRARSSFTVENRGGVPHAPDDYSSAPLTAVVLPYPQVGLIEDTAGRYATRSSGEVMSLGLNDMYSCL